MSGEKEKENSGSAPSGNELEHDVAVMGTPFKVKLPVGATFADILQELKKKGVRVEDYQYELNNRDIDIKKENPILNEASTISLVKKITGGEKK